MARWLGKKQEADEGGTRLVKWSADTGSYDDKLFPEVATRHHCLDSALSALHSPSSLYPLQTISDSDPRIHLLLCLDTLVYLDRETPTSPSSSTKILLRPLLTCTCTPSRSLTRIPLAVQ